MRIHTAILGAAGLLIEAVALGNVNPDSDATGPDEDVEMSNPAADCVQSQELKQRTEPARMLTSHEKTQTPSIVVTGEGPIARCCSLHTTPEKCRAYLASDLKREQGQRCRIRGAEEATQ